MLELGIGLARESKLARAPLVRFRAPSLAIKATRADLVFFSEGLAETTLGSVLGAAEPALAVRRHFARLLLSGKRFVMLPLATRARGVKVGVVGCEVGLGGAGPLGHVIDIGRGRDALEVLVFALLVDASTASGMVAALVIHSVPALLLASSARLFGSAAPPSAASLLPASATPSLPASAPSVFLHVHAVPIAPVRVALLQAARLLRRHRRHFWRRLARNFDGGGD